MIPSSPLLITSLTIFPALPATDTEEANSLTMRGTVVDILIYLLQNSNELIKYFVGILYDISSWSMISSHKYGHKT